MKPTIYLFLFLFSLTLSSQSTTFQKCLGGSSDDLGTGVELIDGYIYTSSTTRSYGAGERDVMINKLDADGNLIWSKVTGTAKRNLSFGIKRIRQELIIYGQTFQDNGIFFHDDVFLKCFDTNGNIIWEKDYGSPNEGHDESAGGFTVIDNEILFSAYNLYGSGLDIPRDGYIGKTDSVGNYIWSFRYDTLTTSPRVEWIEHLFSSSDAYYASGRMAVVGEWPPSSLSNQLFLMKLNFDGQIDWWKYYNIEDSNNSFLYTSLSLADGSILIVGGIDVPFSGQEGDILLIKVDSDGNIIWSKSYQGNATDIIYAAIQNGAGDIVLCGETNSYGAGDSDGLMMKISTDGDIVWTKTYGAGGFDSFADMRRADNGDLIVVGTTNSYCGNSNNIYLVRCNNEGEILGDGCYANQDPFQVLDVTMTTTEGGHTSPWQESTSNSFQLSSLFLAAPEVICLATDIDEVEEISPSFKTSPNPFTDQLIIETDGFENEIVDIRIINLTGQQLFFETKRVNGNITLNTKSLPNGLLILNLNTANKQFSSKIIKTSR